MPARAAILAAAADAAHTRRQRRYRFEAEAAARAIAGAAAPCRRKRWWLSAAAFKDGVYVEPDGKRRVSVEAAMTAQTLREFGP